MGGELPTPNDDGDLEHTAAFTPVHRSRSRSRSRGLQIRCPHCSNPVEMLVDTPYEEISCGSCGSTFSLIDREHHTREAATLKNLGRFELVSRIGIGGFGSVWKARDTELDRVVAIKIPRKGQLGPAEVEQFFREARAAAQLRHRNIIPVHEVGRHEDAIFIVSEFVRGVDLGNWLTAKSMGFRDAIALCQKVAWALHHAHQHGVIHRDLKPSNIMIDDEGEPNLMDFGLAKREVAEITMTIDGQILGTPAYMSPEQAEGRSHWTDRRTDIYSMGVILFRLLTGELPFRGEAQMQIHQRLTEDAPDPRRLNRHIPKDLATICLKCLERDPNGRYATAQLLADELGRFLEGAPIEARPISRLERAARWAKRKPALAGVAALTVLLAIGGPVTAAVIESQRRRLSELVAEKNNLIERNVSERRALVADVANLGKQLDRWEGRANPWDLWPPKPEAGPRRTLLLDVRARRFDAVAASLAGGDHSPIARACGHVALALLADVAKHPTDAKSHWHAAADELKTISLEKPNESAVRLALAECYRRLAQYDANHQAALDWLQQAASLLPARASESNPHAQLTALEVAVDQAVYAGFENGQQALARAAALEKEILDGAQPNDPVGFYRLVCLVAGRRPILAEAAETDRATSEAADPADAPNQ